MRATSPTQVTARRALLAWGCGLLWSQAAAAIALVWLPPKAVLLGEGMSDRWVAIARWTLLLPVTVAQRMSAATPGSRFTLLLTANAVATLTVFSAMWGLGRMRRPWRDVAALVLVSALCAAGLGGWRQLDRAQRAERSFFALVSEAQVPWRDRATVSAADRFAAEHPESRWAGEALRIVAMSRMAEKRWPEALVLWRRFDREFAQTGLPGEAYAEHALGECAEALGRPRKAAAHYRAAVWLLGARTDGIQGWLAADAATRLSRLEGRRGLVAVSHYWNERSQALTAACSSE